MPLSRCHAADLITLLLLDYVTLAAITLMPACRQPLAAEPDADAADAA